MRLHSVSLLAFALVLAVAPLATATASAGATPKAAAPWTGFGATQSNFIHAHPVNSVGCTSGGCYGVRYLTGAGGQKVQFITVMFGAGRVDAYEQIWGSTVSIAGAKQQVLKLLPADTVTTATWTSHDSQGDTCVFWNVKSKTLASWLGVRPVYDLTGSVGIALEHPPTASNSKLVSTPLLVSNSATEASLAILSVDTFVKGSHC